MAKFFLTIVICFFSLVVAAAPCGDQNPYKVNSLQQISKNACMETLKSQECQDLFAKMRAQGEKPEEKALKCVDQSSLSRSIETSWGYTSGCAIGGWNFVKDTFVSLGTAIGEGAAKIVIDIEAEAAANKACDADPKIKNTLFTDYNQNVPKLMHVDKPADNIVATTSCASIKATLKMLQVNKANDASLAINTKIARQQRDFTADEQEFMEWGKNQLPKDHVDLVAVAKDKLKEMGVKLECYNSQAAAAMVCEAIAEVGTLAAGPAGWALKAARIKNIMKIAGVALDAEKAGAAANVSRAVATASDLEKAAKLTNAERIVAAEKSLGRSLTEPEKKALIDAHEVAGDTGRGYNTYSATDLKQKADILKKAGFSDTDRDLLMRQGLAGSLTDTKAAANFANTQRLAAERAGAAGKMDEAKKSYKASADSYEVVLNDNKVQKTSRDYWVASKVNASAERYDKASDYFIKSHASETNSAKKSEAVFEALRREKDELRVIASKNSSSASAKAAYENHRKLIEAVINNPQIKFSDAVKYELLKP